MAALVSRVVSNAGKPLYSPGAQLRPNTVITFTLVDANGIPTDAWDALSEERVGGTDSAITTSAGVFTCTPGLWPNSRGNKPTKYLCHVDDPAFADFYGTVDDVVGTLEWVDFMLAGEPMSAEGLTALAQAQAAAAAAQVSALAAAASAAAAVQFSAFGLAAWAQDLVFRLVSCTRNSDGAITAASIVWPDGTAGVYTADTLSTTFPGATDAWHATYLGTTTKTITQPAMTRDATTGAITAQPPITIV